MKLLFTSIGFILAVFALGWEAAIFAGKHDDLNSIDQAVPVIRFERFDEARKALIIGLFNPGALPIEISRTELLYERGNKAAPTGFAIKEYGNKPLVLDPGDTILVPLAQSLPANSTTETGSYWGQLDFRIAGKIDFYSMRHKFNSNRIGTIKHSIKN